MIPTNVKNTTANRVIFLRQVMRGFLPPNRIFDKPFVLFLRAAEGPFPQRREASETSNRYGSIRPILGCAAGLRGGPGASPAC